MKALKMALMLAGLVVLFPVLLVAGGLCYRADKRLALEEMK